MLAEQVLRKGLNTKTFGHRIFAFDSIDSTNNCAKAVAGCGAVEGTVIIAEHQTDGRGRQGRIWQSRANENLMFSVILRPVLSQEGMNLLPLYVAVAVADAIERNTGVKTECKWPNDLLADGKKVAGILIEGSFKQNSVEYVVVGIGVNVNQMKFSTELEQSATSLRLVGGREVDRVPLFKEILRSMERLYRPSVGTGFRSIIPAWLGRSSMVNTTISVDQQGTVISGVVKGLSPEGGLILQTNGVEKTIFAGDVHILRPTIQP